MPTKIEPSDVEQCYELAQGQSDEMLAERRSGLAIAGTYVRVAVASACLGSGVPHSNIVPMRHR